MKTNAELFLGYGFMLPEREDFHNDYVHIKTKPADDDDFSSTHIVSLRPISDPSSVVARSRRLTSSDDIEVPTEFTHIQDSLVLSLYEAIVGSSGVEEVDEVSMDDLMAGNFPKPIREKIIQALGSKLSYDMDALEDIECPTENLNANQQLAVLYREQCRQVFENALRSLANAMDSE
jgi:histone-lysine N-methyltransferase SETD3